MAESKAGNKLQFVAIAIVIVGVIGLFLMQGSGDNVSGQTVKVDLKANNVDDVAGAQITLKYDDQLLDYQRVEEGSFLKQDGAETFFRVNENPDTPGVIEDIIVVRVSDSGVSGSGTIATAYFSKTGSGEASPEITAAIVSDSQGNPLDSNSVEAEVSLIK